MQTYKETVLRYRVVRHTEYDAATKASFRLNGIDPDDNWSLVWSFEDLESAERQAERDRKIFKAPTYTIKVVDNGEASVIERPIY